MAALYRVSGHRTVEVLNLDIDTASTAFLSEQGYSFLLFHFLPVKVSEN